MDSHNANIANGIYTADIGITTLHAFCNDNEGFAIYAAGYTGDEIGGTNSNKLVGTSASSNATIESGIATSAGNPDISNWAMKLTMTQDSGDTTTDNAFTIDSAPNVDLPSQAESGTTPAPFSSYHVVPNEYVKVAHKNSGTDMTATTGGVKLTATYAAYISKTQAADTYSGQVIYTLVHPSSHAAPVALNPNADDISEVKYLQDFAVVNSDNRNSIIASMVPEQQYIVKDSRDNKTYTISKFNTLSKKTSAEFMAYYNSCKTECSDSLYNNLSDEWKIVADSCNVTVPKTGDNIVLCDESLIPLHETTDVWMTKNLDLDIDSSRTYTNEDTDLGYNTTTNSYDTASWTPTRSTYTTATNNIHEWCQGGTRNSEDGYCEQNNTPESYDPGDLYWNTEISDWSDWDAYYNSCDNSTNPPSCDESLNPLSTYTSSTGAAQYHLGNYYNWAAAIASNDASIYGVYNDNTGEYENLETHQSICPAGWTLPYAFYNNNTGQSEGGFAGLWSECGWTDNDGFSDISTVWSAPLYFASAGGFSGNPESVGAIGSFWSSVAADDGRVYYAYFDVNGYADPAIDGGRYPGGSVRCLLR